MRRPVRPVSWSISRAATRLAIAFVVVAALSVALTAVTIRARTQTNQVLSDALESVRVVQQIEVSLLSHAQASRAGDREQMRQLRERLDRESRQFERFIANEAEAAQVRALRASIAEYLVQTGEGRSPPESGLNVAMSHAESLIEVNLVQAERARQATQDWSGLSNLGVLGLTALLLASGVGAWIGVHRLLVRPITDLASTIERYGAGDPQVRAETSGPRELHEVAEQFNRMADSIARQRDSQLSFLASVVHELRNPLQALSLAVSAARAKTPDSRWDLVGRQVGTLSRLVDDLLETSRIEGGKLELRNGRVELGEVLHQVVELFRASSPERELQLELGEAPVQVDGDRLRLSQVFTNLVSNALKYSPAGAPVTVTMHAEDGAVRVDVLDRGVGISEDDQRHLFEPFRRGKNVRDVVPGVGLGLSVSQRIARAHRGEISVQSRAGEGSTFTVRLPLAGAEVHRLTEPASAFAP